MLHIYDVLLVNPEYWCSSMRLRVCVSGHWFDWTPVLADCIDHMLLKWPMRHMCLHVKNYCGTSEWNPPLWTDPCSHCFAWLTVRTWALNCLFPLLKMYLHRLFNAAERRYHFFYFLTRCIASLFIDRLIQVYFQTQGPLEQKHTNKH